MSTARRRSPDSTCLGWEKSTKTRRVLWYYCSVLRAPISCKYMNNNKLTAGTRIEVKVLPFDPPYSGIVHNNQDGVMTGKVRVLLDARTGLAEASRMTSVKISAVKVIA